MYSLYSEYILNKNVTIEFMLNTKYFSRFMKIIAVKIFTETILSNRTLSIKNKLIYTVLCRAAICRPIYRYFCGS